MTKISTLTALVVTAMLSLSSYTAIAGTSCGSVGNDSLRVSSDKPSNGMDEKVEGCPNGYDWNACCNICGSTLEKTSSLSKGWTCAQGALNGVWLRGCNKSIYFKSQGKSNIKPAVLALFG